MALNGNSAGTAVMNAIKSAASNDPETLWKAIMTAVYADMKTNMDITGVVIASGIGVQVNTGTGTGATTATGSQNNTVHPV